jgi:hypothetical protein
VNTRQVPDTFVRKQMWKQVSTVSGMVGALLAKILIQRLYQAIRKEEPTSAFDPTAERFSWPNALVWAAAGGVGLVVARIVSNRIAVIGWEAATGTLPPGAVETSPVG